MGGGREGLNIQDLYESHRTNPQIYPHGTDFLRQRCGLLMPTFPPSQERDQRACGMPLLPASTFRSIKRRIETAQSPQVCKGSGGVKKGVGRLKDTGRLNPNHCSGPGNRASTPR